MPQTVCEGGSVEFNTSFDDVCRDSRVKAEMGNRKRGTSATVQALSDVGFSLPFSELEQMLCWGCSDYYSLTTKFVKGRFSRR